MGHMGHMDRSAAVSPRVLVVEDDPDIGEGLAFMLEDQGYAPHVAPSLERALALVDTQTFQCILSDLFAEQARDASGSHPLASIAPLRQQTYPTPIIVVTAWPVVSEEAAQYGLYSIVAKPFNVDDLLTTIAASLATPLSPEQEWQAQVVHAYFAALTAKDWDALLGLCTDDVIYVLPGAIPLSSAVQGKAAFRTYTEDIYQHFPDAVFDDVHVYAHPYGLAARFHGSWHTPDGPDAGNEHHQSGAVLFSFVGDHIAAIGVQLNTERLRALVPLLRA